MPVVVETRPTLRKTKVHAMLVKTFVRRGRSVPLPADERSNKPADAEEAQSCRGLDDSCLSNIIVLHRWLVPARHDRLLHCSTPAPATLKYTTRQALPVGTEHVLFRQAWRRTGCKSRTLSKRADEGQDKVVYRCSAQNIGECSKYSETLSCIAHRQLVSSCFSVSAYRGLV